MLSCLLLLSACASDQQSTAQLLISNTCPIISPCNLPPSNPITNADLELTLEHTEAAWAQCAAKVDIVIECQADVKSIVQ
ncbi:Rz1-like lysis system protein LysC [Gammaproteobacteria bacterium AS21]